MITDLQRELIETVSGKNFDRVTKVLQNVECQTMSLYRGEVETQTEEGNIQIWNNAEEQHNFEMQKMHDMGQIRRMHKDNKQGFKNVFNIQQSFTPSAITDQCTMNT